MNTDPAKRKVFLVHGRDGRIKSSLTDLLREFDLQVVSWEKAVAATNSGSPSILDVVKAGMNLASAVVVLFTPDDLAQCKPEFVTENDGDDERQLTGQARQNVMFEAGMALALGPSRTILVRHGSVRDASDLSGINYIPITDAVESRRNLGERLRTIGLSVDMDHERWRNAGEFAASNADIKDALTQGSAGFKTNITTI